MPGSEEELKAALVKLQSWQPSVEQGEVVQAWINWLDQAIPSVNDDSVLFNRAIHRLQKLCRSTERLPGWCSLPDIAHHPRPVSSSAYSDVYRGEWNGRPVALKVLRLHVDNQAKVTKAFCDEVVAWRHLKHPHVVPFLGVSSAFSVCLVSEWMPHGTVATYLKENPQADRLALIQQIIDGLQYMHSREVIHGDLKAANVLVSAQHIACLTDFGLATVQHNTGTFSSTTTGSLRGTLRWMSPELIGIHGENDDHGRPTVKSDIYALAMVFWEIFTGRIPFDDIRHDFALFGKISEGFRPERPVDATPLGLSDSIWTSMTEAWSTDPDQRPTLAQLAIPLNHEIPVGPRPNDVNDAPGLIHPLPGPVPPPNLSFELANTSAGNFLSPLEAFGGASLRRSRSDHDARPGHRVAHSEDLRAGGSAGGSAGVDAGAGADGGARAVDVLSLAVRGGPPQLNDVFPLSSNVNRGHHRRASSASRSERGVGLVPNRPVPGRTFSARTSPYPSPKVSPRSEHVKLPPIIGGGSTHPEPADSAELEVPELPGALYVPRGDEDGEGDPVGGLVPTLEQNVTISTTKKATKKRYTVATSFACPVPGCGSTFTRQFNLKGHMRSHNEEKLYRCKWPGCSKSFVRQHDCKRHWNLHLNIRPFTCDGCKKMFARMDALNRHLKSEAGVECQKALQEPTAGSLDENGQPIMLLPGSGGMQLTVSYPDMRPGAGGIVM